jgi:hydrogenase maturation factor
METNIPGKITEINDKEIIVDYNNYKGLKKVHANGTLIKGLKLGDYVIVSNKIIIAEIPKERAKRFLDLIK